MVRKTGGIGGSNYFKDPKGAGDKHQKEQTTKAASNSKFFRNFRRTKRKAYMTTYTDDQHLNIMLNTLSNISAGDPQTAFNALLDSWKIGAKTGNMKEVDATELADFKTWVAQWLTIAWDVAAQLCLRPFLGAMTESSVTATSSTTVAIWTQADWDAFLASLEKLECPDFVYRFMKPFLYYIRLTDSFVKAELPIPPSYLLLIVHTHTLAQLQAHRESAKAVMGTSQTHCQKYGIPFSKFSVDKLKCTEVTRNNVFNNQDLIAFFTICPFIYTWKTGPTVKHRFHAPGLTGANLTTDYSYLYYCFDEKQEMSIMHALYPLFGLTYHATNNPYGEIISYVDSGAGEYAVNMLRMAILGTSWTAGYVQACRYGVELLMAYWVTNTDYVIDFHGDELTATQTYGITAWLAFHENMNICLDTGDVQGAEVLDQAFNAAKYMIYGD